LVVWNFLINDIVSSVYLATKSILSKMNNSDESPLGREQKYDIFLSFDTDDKEFASALYEILHNKYHIKMWYSTVEFRKNSPVLVSYEINKGLKYSEYCVAIFSPNSKNSLWFYKELGAFDAKEKIGRKLIIPVLYKIDIGFFISHFPLYASGFAITNYQDIEEVAAQILKYIGINIEIDSEKAPLHSEEIPRQSEHTVKYTDASFYPEKEESLEDTTLEKFRRKTCFFHSSDPHYFIRISMEDFFSTSE